MIKLIIFDLDGTLLNTLGDLGACCNEVLERRGYPTHPLSSYPSFIGNGIRRLVERSLPEAVRCEPLVEELREEFVALYCDKIDRYTTPYAGIFPMLERLSERGIRLAVVSNKFQAGVDRLMARFFPTIPFVACFGQSADMPLKPNPAVDLSALRLVGASPEEALHVGDSPVDIATARAAGLRSVAVTWGFCREEHLGGADHLIHRPEELLALLDR